MVRQAINAKELRNDLKMIKKRQVKKGFTAKLVLSFQWIAPTVRSFPDAINESVPLIVSSEADQAVSLQTFVVDESW